MADWKAVYPRLGMVAVVGEELEDLPAADADQTNDSERML